MFKSTIQVTFFSVLGIGISFFIQLLLAYYFGATNIRDAYFAALTIPAYLTALFVGSVGMMFLPYLVHQRETGFAHDKTVAFTCSVINFCCIGLLLIVAAGCLWAKPIMNLILPPSKEAILDIAVSLFKIQMISIFFTVLSNMLGAIFQAKHSFLLPALFPVITNLFTLIFVVFFSDTIGIHSIVYGTLTGAFLSFVFIFINVLKQFEYQWKFTLQHSQLRSILLASLPLFGAGILFRSTTVIERFFAARLPDGSLSYLGSGNQIIVILSTLVSSGIATTSFPLLSKYWSNKEKGALGKSFINIILLIIMIILPLIVIFIVNGADLVRIFFERGAFTPNDTLMLYYCLLALMGYLLFSSLGNVVARLMYLSKNTWLTTVIGTVELVVYLSGAFILSGRYGFVGLAISMSIGACFNIIVSLFFIRKRIVDFNIPSLLSRTGKFLVISCFILFLVLIFNHYFLKSFNSFIRVFISLILIVALYWIPVVRILKNMGYKQVFGVLKK